MRKTHTVFVFALLGIVASGSYALAADVAGDANAVVPAADKLDVEIWSIRATTKNKDISPELKPLAAVLKKQFKYTGFKLEKRDRNRVDLNKPARADLTGPYRAQVTPKEKAAGKVKLEILVVKKVGGKDKQVLKTTVTVSEGALVPIGCGSLDDGDYVIAAVRAR